MKRTAFRVPAACLTLIIIGAAATPSVYLKFFYIGQPLPEISLPETAEPAESAPLTFCELANNPEKYDGKIVSLSAKLTNGIEGSWFFDPVCGADNAAVVTSANKEVWRIITKARDEKNNASPKNEKSSNDDLDLTVTGKFKNLVYNEGGLTAPFQFEISTVEKASP